jgi:myosin I
VFVRFYERLGTVGIWGFSDGCFQVCSSSVLSCFVATFEQPFLTCNPQMNFPDHTKMVISADGKFCSFTCLSVEAMLHLSDNNELPYRYIKQREVLSGSISGLLYGTADGGSNIVATTEANLFQNKLKFIIDVMDEWISGGGLGCSTDGPLKPKWEGPHLEDGKKQDWVTVGRHGGDTARD